jgi:hypothetical protein
MVEDTTVRDAASGPQPDADIVSAWKADFAQQRANLRMAAKVSLTLPSGNPIKAMRMPLAMLLQSGAIPDRLTKLVSNFIDTIEASGGDEKKATAMFGQEFEEDVVKTAQHWVDMLNFVFCHCVITPQFVSEAKDANSEQGIFWVGQVNFYDKLYVFQWAQGVDQSVEAFFLEQIDAVGTASDGEGLRPTPEQLLASGEYGSILASVADRPGDVDVGPVHPRTDRRNRASSGRKTQNGDAERPEIQERPDSPLPDRPAGVVSAPRQRKRQTAPH